MYLAGTWFSIDIQPPPGWDDIAAGEQGLVIWCLRYPSPSASSVFSASQREEEEGGTQLEVSGPKIERGEKALGLVGTKLRQPCLLKPGASQKCRATRFSLETLQKSLWLRGSRAPPASAWG